MSTLAEILPSIWHKLIPKQKMSPRSMTKLTRAIAERHSRFDRLNRCGITNADADNFYSEPLDPKKDQKA